MSPVQPQDERETRAMTLGLLILGFVCYALPWSAFAELPLPAQGAPLLRIQGSNTIGAKLAPALVRGLLQEQGLRDVTLQPGAANEQLASGFTADGQRLMITVAAHGSGTGFVALKDGSAELAASSRPVKAAEAQALQAFGDMRSREAEQVIAIDGLAIIVNPANPLTSLTTSELAAIFAGDIRDWSQLGGPPGAIRLYARDDNSGTYDTFKELVLVPQAKSLNSAASRYESSDELSEQVGHDPQGIGFIGLPYIHGNKALAIADGDSAPMLPSRELVATEDYPLSRRLFFYLRPGEDNPWAQALTDYAQSAAGQAIVAQSGFIEQTVKAMEVATAEDMPEEYRQLAREARRLNVNFRFREGSATLDNKAQYDLERVAAYLKAQDKLYRKVVLVGFGDPKSKADRAKLLSRLRGLVVSRELGNSGLMPREVIGFGDELPVAANNADEGRQKNRRVEIWVY